MDKLGYLSRINIMEELPAEGLAEVGRLAPMNTVPRGTVISRPGHEREVVYMLKEGRVRIYRLSADGKEFTSALLGPGNIFGQAGEFLLGVGDSYAEALEDCVLCLLTRADLERLLEQYPRLARRMVQVLSERLREAEELMGYLALADLRSRLLYLLVKLAQEFGEPAEPGWVRIDADLTHQDLARMVGATREAVSAHLGSLSREGLVQTGRKQLTVHLDECSAVLGRLS